MKLKIQFLLVVINFACFNAQDNFSLPNTTQPESYVLIMKTNVPEPARAFSGILSVTVRVLESTNEIFLHSRQHRINDFHLYERNGPENIELEDVLLVRETDDVIKFTTQQELHENSLYELQMDFQGNLLLDSDGFFRSDYVVNDNGNNVFT